MMINNTTPFLLKLVVVKFGHTSLEQTNKNSIKAPKVFCANEQDNVYIKVGY